MVRFERLINANRIPTKWIEQVKDLVVEPENYRKAIEASLDDLGMLFGLYTPVYSGFLWCQFDPLENMLYVNCYSVDKSIWHTKDHLKCLIKLLEWLKSILKVEKVRWFTTRPGLYRRLGFKPSKRIMMEA